MLNFWGRLDDKYTRYSIFCFRRVGNERCCPQFGGYECPKAI